MSKPDASPFYRETALLALIAVMAACIWLASLGREAVVSLFPQIVAVTALLLIGYRLAGMFLARRRSQVGVEDSGAAEKANKSDVKPGTLKAHHSTLLLVAYFTLVSIIGFYLATFIYLFVMPQLLKGLKPLKSLFFAGSITVILYFVFKAILVFMPAGILFS